MVTVMTTAFLNSLCIAFILLHTNCCPPTKASLFNIVPWMNLTSTDLRTVTQRTSSGDLERVFRKINVIREVDTPSHAAVRKYIMDYLTSRGWFVELDSFHQPTVIGPRTFHNIIARLSSVTPDHNLVLACHYDSKRMPNFFGSVDSAMPCAILLEMADILTSSITRQKNPVLGIQLVFFDGEEAFLNWSDTDSLYGSRHLAEKWSKPGPDGQTELSKIKLLVLLDLIGAHNLSIPDYGYTNEPYFELFTRLEHTMNQNYLLRNPHSSSHRYFRGSARGQIQDDHIPFFRRGVPILHLIPASFPPVWHTDQDNENNISWDVSMDMLNLMVAFVQSFLHLTL